MHAAMRERIFDSSYRMAYSFLSMLPEDTAVPLGQYLLKRLPVENVAPESPCVPVEIGGVRLESPVVLASYYKDPEIWVKSFSLGFGAVTTKTVTLEERTAKPKSVVRLGNGFVNCERFLNYGLEKTKEILEKFRENYFGRGKLIISIGAVENIDEYGKLAKELSDYADMIEVNASSPNSEIAYSMAKRPYCVESVTAEVVEYGRVIWKLSPDFAYENMAYVIPALIKNGIKTVNWANTRKVKDRRLHAGEGGESGPGLYPNVLWNVELLRKKFGKDLSIIACGGIDSEEKALAALQYADVVSMLSGFVRDIGLPRRINRRLAERRH